MCVFPYFFAKKKQKKIINIFINPYGIVNVTVKYYSCNKLWFKFFPFLTSTYICNFKYSKYIRQNSNKLISINKKELEVT